MNKIGKKIVVYKDYIGIDYIEQHFFLHVYYLHSIIKSGYMTKYQYKL